MTTPSYSKSGKKLQAPQAYLRKYEELNYMINVVNRDYEKIITHTFDLKEIALYRRDWGVFRDRRTDLYNEILNLDGSTIERKA